MPRGRQGWVRRAARGLALLLLLLAIQPPLPAASAAPGQGPGADSGQADSGQPPGPGAGREAGLASDCGMAHHATKAAVPDGPPKPPQPHGPMLLGCCLGLGCPMLAALPEAAPLPGRAAPMALLRPPGFAARGIGIEIPPALPPPRLPA
ncbi:hypothetical protein [Siccirubricoccus phaeus]|uniref:hypothetical protein n=1 Tax=Siccirubricoccus phaeus TaxID=2595053 RepID=UPI00165B8111|nr:hypothetical protein [Siccirubricoccus phaeus]